MERGSQGTKLTKADTGRARRNAEAVIARARDPHAVGQHALASRVPAPETQAPLSGITAPTLVIHGTRDPLFPLALGRQTAALIPGARFHEVPGMGHWLFSPGLPTELAHLILAHTASAASTTA